MDHRALAALVRDVHSDRLRDWLRNIDLLKASTRRRRVLQLLQRDGDRCHLCGAPLGGPPTGDSWRTSWHEVKPSIDHVVPRAHGGSSEMRNLRLAHAICNWERGCIPLDAPSRDFESLRFSRGRSNMDARSIDEEVEEMAAVAGDPIKTCRKDMYATEGTARAISLSRGQKMRAYYCAPCRAWHLTSRLSR